MRLRDRAAMVVATVGCFGRSPLAPGTVGSAVALPLCWALSRFPPLAGVIVAGAMTLAAVAAAHRAEQLLASQDPGCIVIDEVVGMVVAVLGLPFNLVLALIGFAVFRVFDIFKPFPIRQLEKRVGGGVGIVLDDVVAGLMTNVVLRLWGLWGINGAG